MVNNDAEVKSTVEKNDNTLKTKLQKLEEIVVAQGNASPGEEQGLGLTSEAAVRAMQISLHQLTERVDNSLKSMEGVIQDTRGNMIPKGLEEVMTNLTTMG